MDEWPRLRTGGRSDARQGELPCGSMGPAQVV